MHSRKQIIKNDIMRNEWMTNKKQDFYIEARKTHNNNFKKYTKTVKVNQVNPVKQGNREI